MTESLLPEPSAPEAGTPQPRLKKRLVAAGLTAGLLAGGAAGFAFTGNSPLASAQDGSTTTTAPASSDAPDARPDRPDPGQRLAEVLAPLVADGTLNQDQADKVIAALEAARPDRGQGGPGGHHGHMGMKQGLDAAATALGMSADELRTELQAGKSIATVAGDKGVDVQTVIDAMVAEAKTKADAKVADGSMTQEEADQRLSQVTERITAMVNGERPEPGERGRGPRGGPPDSADAPDATGSSTN